MSTHKIDIKDASLLETRQYIGGQWSLPTGQDTFQVLDPGTGEPWWQLTSAGSQDTDAAIAAAHAAFASFSAVLPRARARMLLSFDTLLRDNLDDIAQILVFETGKPLVEARGEVEYALTFSWWLVGEVERQHGQTVRGAANPSLRFFTIKQAIGPVALLTPWNFPVALFVRKVVTALAAGCTVVAKPSPETPISTLAIAHLLERAGFTSGIVNVLLASNEATPAIGEQLCLDARIKKISFTGSTRVGRLLMRQCAPNLKKLTLELGGLGAYLVFEDADLEKAAQSLIANKFRHAGQTCIAAQRVYVQRSVIAPFSALLLAHMKKLKMGHGTDETVTLGPVQTLRGREKGEQHIQDAVAKGATLLRPEGTSLPPQGFFVEPSLLLNCTKSMLVYEEESFAPLLALSLFDTEEEVIALANDTEMGLTDYVFTKDAARLWRCYENLKAGNVGLNVGITTSAEIPFGGIDQSGFGKEAGISAGLSEYTIEKSATMAID